MVPRRVAGLKPMSHLKVVRITDHETRRARDNLLVDMAVMASAIADELMAIDIRLRVLQAEIDRLKQEGVPPKPSA
jgi:hypothetical protein